MKKILREKFKKFNEEIEFRLQFGQISKHEIIIIKKLAKEIFEEGI